VFVLSWQMLLVAAVCVLVLLTASVLSRGSWRRPSHGKTIDRVAGTAGALGGLASLVFFLWLCGVLPR
jgi:hypothetical protein